MENPTEFSKTAPQHFFETEFEKARLAQAAAQKRFNALAIVRLSVFAGILVAAWIWNRTGESLLAIVVVALIVAFFILMKKHQAVKRKRDFQRNIQTVNEDELERLAYRFKRTDTGTQFSEKEHAYATDLDIFGGYSLYKLLNRTRTAEGSRRLANWLKNHADTEEIALRQQTSIEFKNQPQYIQEWEATALLHEKAAQQIGTFRAWITEKMPDELVKSLRLRWVPLLTLVIGIAAILKLIPVGLFLLALAAHFLILRRYLTSIQQLTNKTATLGRTLIAYADLLKNAESAPFTSPWWLRRKEFITGSSSALHQAGSLFERLDYRNNPFFSLFVGLPTLWDLHCLAALESWKETNRSKLADWLDVLADTEAMNSLAGYAFANPECVIPEVSRQDDVFIKAKEMGHPLIPGSKRVSNSFEMNGTGHTILITGSNMSGKSTFLRTIGLNFVLAQTGAVVSADSFSCAPVRIFSSMRTQDSLEESTSSFYAELKRLRKLLELADEKSGTPVFYLLDEILKGTNSADRHRGAEALIRQLHKKNASGLVSTHDLELGEWGATENYVHNFHFRSDVENGKLHFDYRLHEGICTSFNASELMRMMGIDIEL
ncbi:MutS-related protein [Dyadobacter sp. CY323]|uniref:MutS-related protein n=1 Tax=Dyadobacter sp. CY323 TaxID=2907302 RepID=UPI001F25FE59|nr:DNA mismatch repair protein MutS [Dyadobacter sp. CY323]MCE6990559.1 DNA mismatch repair protein MutS [Dyadobacter sp. CY323]